MKNQNDIIFSSVAVFILIVVGCLCFFMKPVPVAPAAPDSVNLAAPTLPSNTQPVMANALPGGGSGGASGGFGGPGTMGAPRKGGAMGMGGPSAAGIGGPGPSAAGVGGPGASAPGAPGPAARPGG